MKKDIIRATLYQTWLANTGFLGKMRFGILDLDLGRGLLEVLKSVEVEKSPHLDKELVALIWEIPLKMVEWRYILDHNYEKDVMNLYVELSASIHDEIYRILGTPNIKKYRKETPDLPDFPY